MLKDLFDWLDMDKDKQISYEDLRQSAGKETNPTEQLFFRQDVKATKQVICHYDKCWEHNTYNSKSMYCALHQKIIRNLNLEKFQMISSKLNDHKWDQLVQEVQKANFQMTLKEFNSLVLKFIGKSLTLKDKEFLFESFRAKESIEDNPDSLDERLISL